MPRELETPENMELEYTNRNVTKCTYISTIVLCLFSLFSLSHTCCDVSFACFMSHNIRNKETLSSNMWAQQTNEPASPHSLFRVFAVRMKIICILGYPKCVQWRLWSDCTNAQAARNLHWTHLSEGTFSDVAAQYRPRADATVCWSGSTLLPLIQKTSRKHAYMILTPLNPIFI